MIYWNGPLGQFATDFSPLFGCALYNCGPISTTHEINYTSLPSGAGQMHFFFLQKPPVLITHLGAQGHLSLAGKY
jgi:hypothetical protein